MKFLDAYEFFINVYYNRPIEQMRYAYCTKEIRLNVINEFFPCSGGIMSKPLYSFVIGYFMSHHNFLIELFDETIQVLITSGIYEQFDRIYNFNLRRGVYSIRREISPLILDRGSSFTIEDLSYGFVLWIFTFMISIIVFLSELSWFHLNIHTRLKPSKIFILHILMSWLAV